MLLFEVGVPPFLKGRWEKGLKITASYRAGYFPILPEVSLQKNKSVLTKDLLSMQCMWGPHLPALIIPKLSKKASSFAKFTCSFDYLCVFWDIPRRHRSLRRASSLDSTPSTSEHGGEAVDPRGLWTQSSTPEYGPGAWEKGSLPLPQAISSLPISWWTRWPVCSDFREPIQTVFLRPGKGGAGGGWGRGMY